MKSESCRSGSLLPLSGNYARRPPRGSRRAELMMTCLATRPHWLLASLFRFQGATTRHRSDPGDRSRAYRSASAEPTLTSASTTPAKGRGRQERPCQSTRKSFSGRTGDTTGCPAVVQLVTPIFCSAALVSPPMGSSGTKKSRKGGSRQHLAKVGTPAERSHTMHAAERDVAGNFGVRGKGWLFWTAVCVIVLIVA